MFVVLKKRTVIGAMALIIAFILCFVGLTQTGATAVFFSKSARKVPVYRVDTTEKKVALTFDAAWGADKTQGIIDILNQYGAKGTFFLVGFWINNYEEEVKKIAQAGLDIGNHSDNHLKMSTLSETEIEKELKTVNDSVQRLTGKTPKFFRPPYGDYNDRLVTKAESMGLQPIQWDVDSLDWKGLSGKEIVDRVCPKVQNGSIVLFHNNSDHVLDALPTILLNLKNEGYEFVTLSDLVYTENYTIDNNGIQHKNTSVS